MEGALLYVDEGAGEALHYIGGLPFVLQLGVRAVCSLENASALDAVSCNFQISLSPSNLISALSELLLGEGNYELVQVWIYMLLF